MATEVSQDLEKWESTIAGTVFVNKFNPSGPPGAIIQEAVRFGRQFLITPEERNLLNSDKSQAHKDPFKNGMLVPVRVADLAAEEADRQATIAEEAARAAEPNPNHATDAELLAYFEERNHLAFKKAISVITSPQTLARLQGLSKTDEANATVSQSNAISDLLEAAEKEGNPDIIEIQQPGRVGDADEGDDRSGFRPIKI